MRAFSLPRNSSTQGFSMTRRESAEHTLPAFMNAALSVKSAEER
jgi:hypothetical protein